MDYIVNNSKIDGKISVYGAKNCVLTLLGASILTDEQIVLRNCPNIVDVQNMIKLLQKAGKNVVFCNDTITVSGGLCTTGFDAEYATLLRGSVLVLGSTVARYGQISLPLPGGCAIGARPIDIHLDGLSQMKVGVFCDDFGVRCIGKPKPARYNLRFASVGATENLVCASIFVNGTTVLTNCATEPEVEALERMLVAMGANIKGIGTSTLQIDGVSRLHGVEFDVIPDRIVTATYLSACVATCGELCVDNCNPNHLTAFVQLLSEQMPTKVGNNSVWIKCKTKPNGYGNVATAPYPLFASDMQSLLLTLSACCNGSTHITENLFENRLLPNATELNKMGANIVVDGNVAHVKGRQLHGSTVQAHDLRGGAALVVAGLCAQGTTIVKDVKHIDRGYYRLAQSLATVGANIYIDGWDTQ